MDANVLIENKEPTPDKGQFLDNFDLSDFVGPDMEYISNLLEIFSHCFKTSDEQHTIMRDLRISLPIPLHEGKENDCYKRTYHTDDKTSKIIITMLRKFESAGLGEMTEPQSFMNPIFLRIKNKEEMEKSLQDEAYIPKSRLISDYTFLNSISQKVNSYIPSTRQCLQSIKYKKYMGVGDASAAYKSLPIHPAGISKTTVGVRGFYLSMFVCLEGLTNAPAYFSSAFENSWVFANPRDDRIIPDLEQYEATHAKGQKRLIENMADLRKYVKTSRDQFHSPESLIRGELKYEDVEDSMKTTPTHKLRMRLSEAGKLPDLIRREDINPHMLPTERSALSFLDDFAMFAEERPKYLKVLLAVLIDISNFGLRLNPTKVQLMTVHEGKGEIEFLGMTISGDGHYRPSSKRNTNSRNYSIPRTPRNCSRCWAYLITIRPIIPTMDRMRFICTMPCRARCRRDKNSSSPMRSEEHSIGLRMV
jgi:hypothetical protein